MARVRCSVCREYVQLRVDGAVHRHFFAEESCPGGGRSPFKPRPSGKATAFKYPLPVSALMHRIYDEISDRRELQMEGKPERADLHMLAAACGAIDRDIESLRSQLDEAASAAYGEYDEETEEAVEGTYNDDDPEPFEGAREKLGEAKFAVADAQAILATMQGFRDFRGSGVVPA